MMGLSVPIEAQVFEDVLCAQLLTVVEGMAPWGKVLENQFVVLRTGVVQED